MNGWPVYLYFLCVNMAKRTYQLIGLAPERHGQTVTNAALSLRPLTEIERGAVTGKRLRVVPARPGERLEDLGARSDNVWERIDVFELWV